MIQASTLALYILIVCGVLILLAYLITRQKYSNLGSTIEVLDMDDAERKISNFFGERNLSNPMLEEVVSAVNVKSIVSNTSLKVPAALSDDKETILIRSSNKDSNSARFDIAHECAHIINGDIGESITRPNKHEKDNHEQYIDYMAAAILLPKEKMLEYLERVNYLHLDKRDKVRHVMLIAKEYNVEDVVVLRRVRELRRFLQ